MRNPLFFSALTASLVNLSACAGQDTVATAAPTQAMFVGQPVSLINDQGRCTLVKPDQSRMALDMEWPCQFSVGPDKQLRVEIFNQVPIFAVERSEHMPAPSRDCLTKLQAVRQIKGTMEVADVSQFAACGPGHWDQKMYVAPFTW
ncbi:hypothetical protein FBY06_14118 [Pseudomonas sp. SJZ085]|uniref:hypothetical protein n=1 Tax=unclassified Pseudomonas TaxID=196821 RepID=UPI00119C1B9B|nr:MULTISPECIES: hypothetical protein [unclassified Pseudomonas]TWC11742.1 hypothetical protein FBX99_14118 [Pseudomonas sp. SJZ074]TWC30501.1 hypothetical protein FBY06_14118 [Pseudomonas sp. SJZ085]